MQTYLGPPEVIDSVGKQICLNRDCKAPLKTTDVNKHADHPFDVVYVKDLVKKLHKKNQKNKEELGHIQDKLYARIESNENAIEALRSEDNATILANLHNLRDQTESYGVPLVEKNNLETYDDLFFSSRGQRKFEILIEPSEKEFKEMFRNLINGGVFRQCQVRCPNHNAEIVSALNLKQNVPPGQRLLCTYDMRDGAQSLQTCELQLQKYCAQEKLFERLYQIKEEIFKLRFHLDCITNKILTQVQNLITIHKDTFQKNQQDFSNKYRLVEPIPQATYENIAEFLSQIGQLPLDDTIQETINKFNTILDLIEKSILATNKNFDHFLNKLIPILIKITVEVIITNNAKVYHLEAQPNATLLDLFNFVKEKMKKEAKLDQNINEKLDQNINQAKIKIDSKEFNQPQQQPQSYVLKNEQFIEFYLQ